MQREARPDRCPQLGHVDLEQQPAVVVIEALARDLDGSGGDLRLQAEDTEGASGVAGQIHAGTCRPPYRRALDHLDRDAAPREHRRERQTGDTATHDQHAPPVHAAEPWVTQVAGPGKRDREPRASSGNRQSASAAGPPVSVA